MNTEKFKNDLQQAHLELEAATGQVMDLVKAGKAFGDAWHAAIERERKAHVTIRWLLDSPLIPPLESFHADLNQATKAQQSEG